MFYYKMKKLLRKYLQANYISVNFASKLYIC